MSPDTIEAVRCALQTVCETGGTMDELALIEQADRIAELERKLADVGSINLSLMEKLAELREAARKLAESVREEGGSLAVVGAKEFRALSSELYDQTEQDNG